MSHKQTIQFGPVPASISDVAMTAWEALERWPPTRACANGDTTSQPPPSPNAMVDCFMRYVARAYHRAGLLLPDGVDDLEAIGEEVEGTVLSTDKVPVVPVHAVGRFWRMARTYHEAILWLHSPAGQDSFWIDTRIEEPLDGQAVLYYFEVVGPHLGWHSHSDHGGGWSGYGGFLGHEVSHWIPLPGFWPDRVHS